MKHSSFSILILAGALMCLLTAFGTKPDTGKPSASATACAQADVSLPALSCPLPAPSSFEGERTSGASAAISWSAVPGSAAYRLIVQDVNTDQVISSTLEYGTSKNLSGLEPGTAYRCSLASVCPDNSVSDFIIVIVDILE